MRYRATLAYDGTAYQGFQRQVDGVPSIQFAVERAVSQVTGQQVTVIGAGRTDTGVHATGQVIAFDVDWSYSAYGLFRAVNAALPDDITLQDLTMTTAEFQPRFDACSRVYRYQILQAETRQPLLRNRTWHFSKMLDLEEMQQAAEVLIGKHDFATFGQAPYGDNTVREVFVSKWSRFEQEIGFILTYEVEATAFLKHMVRRMVGVLVEVGRGRITVEQLGDILRSADLARVKLVAPPQGLTLYKVKYPDEKYQKNREEIVPCFVDKV